jgi:hypothetical protein
MRVLASGQPGDNGPRPVANGAVRFSLVKGAWQKIALKYRGPGKECIAPRSKERQMYYTLHDGRSAYFPYAVGEAIQSLSLAPGQDFWIRHDGGDDWQIERNDPSDQRSAVSGQQAESRSRNAESFASSEAAARVPVRSAAPSVQARPPAHVVNQDAPRPEGSSQASAAATLDTFVRNGGIMRRCYAIAMGICADSAASMAADHKMPVVANFDSIERTAVALFIAETREAR